MPLDRTKPLEIKKNAKTLVLGIGNPILRDDRIGHLLVQLLRNHQPRPDIELQETSSAGLNLAELLSGFDSAIVIDAIKNGGTPGEIYCLKPQDLHTRRLNPEDQHSTGLLQALELGKSIGWPMPEDVVIVAIEAEDTANFGDDLTPRVAEALPSALQTVLELLDKQREQLCEV